jgi:hypothetical protein
MNYKKKSKLWILTFPFAHNNYTTIGNTIYYANKKPDPIVIAHEKIHAKQQKEIGIVKFILLYLFCCPLFYNPWRYKWEFEAYTKGSGYSSVKTRKILKSYLYGWLYAIR